MKQRLDAEQKTLIEDGQEMSKISLRVKYVLFSLAPLILLLLGLELGLRAVHYQRHSAHSLAILHGVDKIRYMLKARGAERKVANIFRELGFSAELGDGEGLRSIMPQIETALFSDDGRELLESFEREYEDNFRILVQEAERIHTKLVVLYIPSVANKDVHRRKIFRDFYRQLPGRYSVDFIDLTDEFLKYPIEWTTLLPENAHLSKFGNKLVVRELSNYVSKYNEYRSSFSFGWRPGLLGDLSPNLDEIWEIKPSMPYRVITNSQGLRMNYDLGFPKQRQRILVLGDSVTFGPYLDNCHAYPNLLDKEYPGKEVINAGVAGYTITDEVSLFTERAKYVEPDITFLQVLDNDIFGLFYFKKNKYDRKRRKFVPSELEKNFIASVVQKSVQMSSMK